jgi:hypothetical protein
LRANEFPRQNPVPAHRMRRQFEIDRGFCMLGESSVIVIVCSPGTKEV